MLGLGIDPDRAPGFEAPALGELDHLLQRRDLVDAVPALVAEGEPFLGAQRLDLCERKVLGEVAFDCLAVDHLPGAPAGKLLRHVGGARNVILMARDQHAILGRHQIGLDEIDTIVDREAVGRERVLGPMTGRAAMADHQRRAAAQGRREGRHSLGGGSERNNQCAIEEGSGDCSGHPLEKIHHDRFPHWSLRSVASFGPSSHQVVMCAFEERCGHVKKNGNI